MSSIKYHRLNRRGIGLDWTLIMIVIIGLIVLGFAQLARRNQKPNAGTTNSIPNLLRG